MPWGWVPSTILLLTCLICLVLVSVLLPSLCSAARVMVSLFCSKPSPCSLLTQHKSQRPSCALQGSTGSGFHDLSVLISCCLPLLWSNHTGLLTIPPQACPTPGYFHFLCPLLAMLFPEVCPWLTPSCPSIPVFAWLPALKFQCLPHPWHFLSPFPALYFSV